MASKRITLVNYTDGTVMLTTTDGRFFFVPPSGTVVRVKKPSTYLEKEVEVNGKRIRLYCTLDGEIEGLEELLKLNDGQIGIVTSDVFEMLKKYVARYPQLKGRVARLVGGEVKDKGWLEWGTSLLVL